MLMIELEDFSYESVRKVINDFFPEIRIELLQTDDMLKELGFVECAPSLFTIDIDEEGLDEMMFALVQLEIDAFNIEADYPAEDDPAYLKYLKYGWLYDVLFTAIKRGKIKTI